MTYPAEPRDLHAAPVAAFALALLGAVLLTGCAAPGPPKPPSLDLPERARKLTAERIGDRVILHFESPDHTTDGRLIRTPTVSGSLCREAGAHEVCEPVGITVGEQGAPGGLTAAVPVATGATAASGVVWVDRLPAELAGGPVRLLSYRVEMRNARGRSAGPSDPVFAAAGAPPDSVAGFGVEGSRLGAVLRWQGEAGDQAQARRKTDVLIERIPAGQAPAPKSAAQPGQASKKAKEKPHHHGKGDPRGEEARQPAGEPRPREVWLSAEAGASVVLDPDAMDGQPYRYLAERRVTVKLGNRDLELRSAPTAILPFTWRPVYPPPAPRDLAAAPFTEADGGGFAVDLVWQPVTVENLTGYRVYREAVGSQPEGKTLLTGTPVPSPGFKDATAQPGARYRYSVTAIDRFGNESAAVTAEVAGAAAP